MPDIALTVEVGRTELGLGNLAIEDPANGYSVFMLGPGALSWRREAAKSPYTHGEVLTAIVKDIQIAPIGVRVSATSAGTLDTRLDALLDAFGQFGYAIGVITNGVAKQWLCQPADWSVGSGGEFDKYHMMSHMYEVTFKVPRHPIPIAGSM